MAIFINGVVNGNFFPKTPLNIESLSLRMGRSQLGLLIGKKANHLSTYNGCVATAQPPEES